MGKNPAWTWYIVWYFFVGGLAAGAYMLAAVADLFGRREDRPIAKLGYSIALPLVLLSTILLTLDLGMPLRTLYMFRLVRLGSPMSVGSWALLGFGLASLVSLALVLRDRPGDLRIRRVVAVPGGLLGFFIASYTGVLLGATNRPLWAGNDWIGPLFLVSAFSTGVAGLAVLAHDGVARLRRFHLLAIGAEALLLVVFLGTLGAQAALFLSGSLAAVFWVGVVVVGLVAPFALALAARARPLEAVAAILVLVGGFALRYLVLTGGQT
ncbi:MAG TPA: polysulfide reductase [Candidatus Rokubacteria bacterium]|nr:MAG: hypothetical protein A2050_08450 [Candidatus Rokubacteria bacterium GWA2_73_35]HBH02799.1 polysulfide reductase [Candidatus Rokubacteria bacterium]